MPIILPPNFNRGLQGYWHLDEDYRDVSNNRYTLTPTNTPTAILGKFGNAKNFLASSSQFATITGASSPNLEITGAITMACWYKPRVVNTVQTVMGKNNAGNTTYRYIATTAGAKIRLIFSGLADGDFTSTNGIAAGEWHFIIATYDTASLKIWINGAKDEQAESGTMSDLSATAFSIGRGGDFNGEYGDGGIDEALVWNRALTDTEALELYRNFTSYYAYSKGLRTFVS